MIDTVADPLNLSVILPKLHVSTKISPSPFKYVTATFSGTPDDSPGFTEKIHYLQ